VSVSRWMGKQNVLCSLKDNISWVKARLRTNTVRFHSCEVHRRVKSTETESRSVFARAERRRNRELEFNGYRVSLLQNKKL
jgi:hypothetical protein